MPSRREAITLTADERREFLDSQKTVILCSNGHDGYPHPMPMWFCVDDRGRVCCTTFAKAQKVVNLERDPRATLLVESGFEYAELKGLVIYARTEIVPDFETVRETLVAIGTRGQQPGPEDLAKVREAVAKTAEKRVALVFTPERYVSWDHAKLGGRY